MQVEPFWLLGAEIRRIGGIEKQTQEPWHGHTRVEPYGDGVILGGEAGFFRHVVGANALADLIGVPRDRLFRRVGIGGATKGGVARGCVSGVRFRHRATPTTNPSIRHAS